MSKTLYESITEIMSHGTNKPKEIKKILESQYGKHTTLNSIYCVKSNIRKSQQSNNVNFDNGSNPDNIDPSSEMARSQQEQLEPIPQEIQKEEKTEIPQNYINQPTSNVITGQKFSLNGTTAPIQVEGTEMSKAYQDNVINQENIENPVQTFPIKVSKLGKVSGNILQGLYSTPQMKKMTNGYEVEESDVKDMNQDVTEMLEYRVGNNLNNPDGDLINVGIDFALVFAKGMFHRIKSTKAKKTLEEISVNSEKNVKKVIQEGSKQMQQAKEQKSIKCNNCNNKDIVKNGLCQECYFLQKINTAQEEHQK